MAKKSRSLWLDIFKWRLKESHNKATVSYNLHLNPEWDFTSYFFLDFFVKLSRNKIFDLTKRAQDLEWKEAGPKWQSLVQVWIRLQKALTPLWNRVDRDCPKYYLDFTLSNPLIHLGFRNVIFFSLFSMHLHETWSIIRAWVDQKNRNKWSRYFKKITS